MKGFPFNRDLLRVILPISLSLLVVSTGLFVPARAGLADTVHLKNGRVLEGLVRNEEGDWVELDLGIGKMKLPKSAITTIDRSDRSGTQALRDKWKTREEQNLIREKELARQPHAVPIARQMSGFFVDAKLNDSVGARMLVDTGASNVLLSRRTAGRLGLSVGSLPVTQGQMADGRMVRMALGKLDKLRVENSEILNVPVSILLEDVPDLSFQDGLLGMSFLSHFNFTINREDHTLVLEKLD